MYILLITCQVKLIALQGVVKQDRAFIESAAPKSVILGELAKKLCYHVDVATQNQWSFRYWCVPEVLLTSRYLCPSKAD